MHKQTPVKHVGVSWRALRRAHLYGLLVVLAGVIATRLVVVQRDTQAAIGDAGNIKVTLTNELGAIVSGATVAFFCDGTAVSFTDNGGRDLDATVGTIEVTPTMGDIVTTGCSTNGEALHITFSSTDGTLVGKTIDSTLTLTATNQVAIPAIQYPLSVTVKDAFGGDITVDTITYNGATPTATSGATNYYWASTAGSGTLVVQKAGYVNASATNSALASVPVGTNAQTSITFGNSSPVSSSISAGSSITAQGLTPTVKLVITDTSSNTIAIDADLAIEKSTDGGTTYSAFTPINISTNTGYDAANPASGAILYRLTKSGYQTLTSSSITPVSTEQSIVALTIAALGRSQSGGSSVTRVAASPLTITPANSSAEALSASTGVEIIKNEKTDLNEPKAPDAIPTLNIPDPEVLGPTRIQWNLPKNIPSRYLPTNVLLSRVVGEGKSARLVELKYIVLTPATTDWFIVEDSGLAPGTEYADRVLTIDGFPGHYALPVAKTLPDTESSIALQLDTASTPENPRILFSNNSHTPETEFAIKVTQLGKPNQYLQADGTLDVEADWRPWYKWGFERCITIEARQCTERDPDHRVLYFSSMVPGGEYTLSNIARLEKQDKQSATVDDSITVRYAPEVAQTP